MLNVGLFYKIGISTNNGQINNQVIGELQLRNAARKNCRAANQVMRPPRCCFGGRLTDACTNYEDTDDLVAIRLGPGSELLLVRFCAAMDAAPAVGVLSAENLRPYSWAKQFFYRPGR
jgi:hypothetical protein